MAAFEMQFTLHEKGYLYFPSVKGGGKLVSAQEYNQLAADWNRVTGRAGQWKITACVAAAIIIWMFVDEIVKPEEWINQIAFLGLVAAIIARIIWISYAPRRLVKGRPDVVSPRPIAEVRREVRSLLSWPIIAIALLFSGAIFIGSLMSADQSLGAWMWLIGSGVLFLMYGWASIKKLTD